MKEERKIKVIHISHESHSYFIGESKNKDLKKLMLGDWYSKTALQIKKYYPEIEIECWTPEKMEKTEKNFIFSGIKYRIFPTTFSLVYALDFSMPMQKALKQEVEKAEQKNIKLIIHLHEYHNLHGLLIATSFKKSYIIAQHHGGSRPWKHIK